jgi:hypothetical protein
MIELQKGNGLKGKQSHLAIPEKCQFAPSKRGMHSLKLMRTTAYGGPNKIHDEKTLAIVIFFN